MPQLAEGQPDQPTESWKLINHCLKTKQTKNGSTYSTHGNLIKNYILMYSITIIIIHQMILIIYQKWTLFNNDAS